MVGAGRLGGGPSKQPAPLAALAVLAKVAETRADERAT
jgi:hypothetical protein